MSFSVWNEELIGMLQLSLTWERMTMRMRMMMAMTMTTQMMTYDYEGDIGKADNN